MLKRTHPARIGPWLLGPIAALVFTPGFALAEVVIHVPSDQPTLQAAVSAVPDGGTIELAAGTYASPAGGFSLSNLNKGFTVRATSPGTVFLDGGNAQPVLKIDNSSPANGRPIVFEGLTFRNGVSSSSSVAGGVSIKRGEATFVDCVFHNNQRFETSPTEIAGGGAGVSFGGRAFFLRSTFSDNRVKNNGGGLAVSGDSEVWVQSSQFRGNRTDVTSHRTTAAGGAISVVNARLFVANSRFESNRSGYVAGAIFVLGSWVDPEATPSAEARIVNSTFEGNQAFPNGVANPGPSEAGAVHAEDQATVRISFSRFLRNFARTGGAVNLYRAIVDVDESVFVGNRADVSGNGGFGGTFSVLSNDTSLADPDRRSGALSIQRSYVRGSDPPTVTTVGKSGGCLQATGDRNRRIDGATAAAVRATLEISDTIFHDCDVTAASLAAGGAFDVYLSDVSFADSMVLASDALGASSSGGAGRFAQETEATISNATFARNSAVRFGGALYLQGSAVNVTGSRFVWNEFSPGVEEAIGDSFGAALFGAGQENWPSAGVQKNQTGLVSSTTFSQNVGMPVFDDDRNSAGIWLNDQRYNSNTFYNTTFGSSVYKDALTADQTAAGLNSLVVMRAQGNTDKSQVANSQPGTPPIVEDLRIVPTRIVDAVAAGDGATATEAFAGYAWSGGSATLDGGPVSGNAGVAEVDDGTHSLLVNGEDVSDIVDRGPTPAAKLVASPNFITSGGTSTLSWQTIAGDFIDAAFDQGLTAGGTSSGSVPVSPTKTTTYRLFVTTEQGGVVLQATVYVDEGNAIFLDGFESSNTTRWSATEP